MFFSRRNPDHIAGTDLADWAALGLKTADARYHVQRLTERMAMPRGSRTGLEGHPVRDQARRRLRRNDRILPHGAGKILFRRLASRPRAGEMDIHGLPPVMADVGSPPPDYFFDAA
jgi:hypothetical protein